VTEGHLAVSVLDVSGNVFHLLPNIGRPESAVSALRDGEEGPLTLRVAYSLEEDRPEGAIAFAVDDSALGKSKVLVLHSDAPIFEEMRPTTESAVGYAEALARQQAAQENLIRSLDSRILTTARP
jgi:serine/threonine-protein kinase